jgi:hypothetical protein
MHFLFQARLTLHCPLNKDPYDRQIEIHYQRYAWPV